MLSLIAERDDEVDRLYFLVVRAIRTATIDLEVSREVQPLARGVPRLQGPRELHRGPRRHDHGVFSSGVAGAARGKGSS